MNTQTPAFAECQKIVESEFLNIQSLDARHNHGALGEAIATVMTALDEGQLRVAEKGAKYWQINDWVKKAILIYFRLHNAAAMQAGDLSFFDKVPLKKWTGAEGVRVVPPAVVRRGSFVEAGAVLMPSYINIGAYVGKNSMVDTWATVGSCAQIGSNVHLSGGVGIGGVLEPVQAAPVIIEDNAFIGSRVVIVEGVHIEEGAVIGAGVVLTASTKIIDVSEPEPVTYKARVPRNSVVIPGVWPKQFPSGTFSVPCALIIGQRSENTDRKTSLNQALRDFSVSV